MGKLILPVNELDLEFALKHLCVRFGEHLFMRLVAISHTNRLVPVILASLALLIQQTTLQLQESQLKLKPQTQFLKLCLRFCKFV